MQLPASLTQVVIFAFALLLSQTVRDVRNRIFNFGSVLEKHSDLVPNEFCSVRFAKTWFGLDSYLLLM